MERLWDGQVSALVSTPTAPMDFAAAPGLVSANGDSSGLTGMCAGSMMSDRRVVPRVPHTHGDIW